jgi:glycosyltransferase involved in cell wall biosynthesis
MLRLAQAGNRVLYVEPTGTRTIKWSDWRRLLARLRARFAAAEPRQQFPGTLTIYAALVFPFPHSRLARWINVRIIRRAVRRWLAPGLQESDAILWLYFPSPLNLDLMRQSGYGTTVYQIMSSVEGARSHADIVASNEALLRECDWIFANSRRLQEQADKVNARSHLFRAGVNLELFEKVYTNPPPKPADMESLQGPLIGYVGALHQWIDVQLLIEVVESMPDCRFCFVGPVVTDLGRLPALPNVVMLGQKSHTDIPSYVFHFDVCIIPYVNDAYTHTAYPAKLNEYLAMGKPVVATSLPELEDYNDEFGDVLRLANGRSEFVAALRTALEPVPDGQRARYQAVARENSWSARLEEMSKLLQLRHSCSVSLP